MLFNLPTVKVLRQFVQVVFLLLFIITILQATYPFKPWLPPELFLWLDPLSAAMPLIANRHFDLIFLVALIVLLSPFVVGRAFCGWVCPLGTVIDLSDKIFTQHLKKINPRWRSVKTGLLMLFVVLALLGIQYSWLMDPLPLLWRSLGVIVLSFLFLLVDTSLAVLIKLGIFSETLMNFQDRLSAYLFPVASPVFANLLLPVLILVIILALSNLTRRFWCRHLCPLGALLGLIAKLSPLQRRVDQNLCTKCGICQRKCKMAAIEEDFYTTEKSECILCLSCAPQCPPAAISYGWQSPRRMTSKIDLSKRGFLGATLGGLIGAGFFKINQPDSRHSDRLIRPPGAITENEFIAQCIRCGECVRICATSGKCLQIAFLETGWEGLLTPLAKFRYGYCEYNCNLCGQICPTKAIQPLTLAEKQKVKMGKAIFLKERCIPYRVNENCLVCEEHCPLPDKAIKVIPQEYIDPLNGSKHIVLYPHVDENLCIGCGICENKCPLNGEAGIVVIREGEERELL